MSTNTYYTYDKSHRMTSQYILGGEAHYYGYNERNMVTSIQDVGGASDPLRTFVYNGLGERVIAYDSNTYTGPAYWSYDGRKFLQDKQQTSVGVFSATNYRHNFSLQERQLGSGTEIGVADGGAPVTPAFDGAGNVTNNQAPALETNDNFVANFNTEQILATDNFLTRPRALSGNGDVRGQTSQEIYYMRHGRVRIPSKGVVLGGVPDQAESLVFPDDPADDLLIRVAVALARLLAALQGGAVMLADDPPKSQPTNDELHTQGVAEHEFLKAWGTIPVIDFPIDYNGTWYGTGQVTCDVLYFSVNVNPELLQPKNDASGYAFGTTSWFYGKNMTRCEVRQAVRLMPRIYDESGAVDRRDALHSRFFPKHDADAIPDRTGG